MAKKKMSKKEEERKKLLNALRKIVELERTIDVKKIEKLLKKLSEEIKNQLDK